MAKENTEELAQQMPVEPAQKSRKESYMEGFRSKHPDWKEDDEEGFYGALADDDAALQKEMSGYKSRDEEMSTALGNSPMNAALFVEAANGTPIPLALIKKFPEEMKAWFDDPSNTDVLEKTFQEHADRIEQNKKLQEEADKNLEESNALIDQMIADGEIKDDAEVDELLKLLGEIAAGLMVNKVQKEWLLAAKKALNHDADVAEAQTKGEIAGRNQKITANRKDNSRGNGGNVLGSANAGANISNNAPGLGSKRSGSMWDGMKTNKLN